MSSWDNIADELYEDKKKRDQLRQDADDREGDPFACARAATEADKLDKKIKATEKLLK